MFLPWSILSWIWIYQKFLSWGHIVFCHHQNTISYVFCMYLVYFAYITWQYRVPLKFYHSTFRRMFQPKLFENSQVGLRWVWPTDYGLPMKPYCLEIQNSWAWADKFWGICGQNISTHFGTVSPLSIFSIIQPISLQKTKRLYPHPIYLFGIWIWIWIWAAKN